MSLLTFRFAPSPNGELHLGHAYCALLNQQMAAANSGRMLLRIEDIDIARCTPESEAAMLRDLEWLGIEWSGPVRRQSQHFATYKEILDHLIRDELVYPAFMSRGDIRAYITENEKHGQEWPRDPDGVPHYPALDKELSKRDRRSRIARGAPFAWRLDMQAATARMSETLTWAEYTDESLSTTRLVEASPADWGDVIIARRDIPVSYHLAVVADDALQDISHVVRGMDLFSATSVQRLLQELLGLAQPRYFHHRLILGPDRRKLSKSLKDTGLATLRGAGISPSDIRHMIAAHLQDQISAAPILS